MLATAAPRVPLDSAVTVRGKLRHIVALTGATARRSMDYVERPGMKIAIGPGSRSAFPSPFQGLMLHLLSFPPTGLDSGPQADFRELASECPVGVALAALFGWQHLPQFLEIFPGCVVLLQLFVSCPVQKLRKINQHHCCPAVGTKGGIAIRHSFVINTGELSSIESELARSWMSCLGTVLLVETNCDINSSNSVPVFLTYGDV